MLFIAMDMLLFNTRDELVRVGLRHVVYFEADGNYTQIFFKNGQKVTILYSLAKLEALLDETLRGKKQPFIRIGKRYIINSASVFQLNTLRQRLVLTNFDTSNVYTLSVSKEALKSLTLLQGGKYKIERVLDQGGSGITYLAIWIIVLNVRH